MICFRGSLLLVRETDITWFLVSHETGFPWWICGRIRQGRSPKPEVQSIDSDRKSTGFNGCFVAMEDLGQMVSSLKTVVAVEKQVRSSRTHPGSAAHCHPRRIPASGQKVAARNKSPGSPSGQSPSLSNRLARCCCDSLSPRSSRPGTAQPSLPGVFSAPPPLSCTVRRKMCSDEAQQWQQRKRSYGRDEWQRVTQQNMQQMQHSFR